MKDCDQNLLFSLDTYHTPQVVYLSELLSKSIDQLLIKNCQLTLSQFKVLFLLQAKGQLLQTELAHILRLSPPAISRQTNYLVAKNYVTRHTNPNNRRTNQLHLTELGIKQIQEAMIQLGAFENMVYTQVPAEELAQFHRTAKALVAILDDCRDSQASKLTAAVESESDRL